MGINRPLPENHPLVQAWRAYKTTDEAQDMEYWARHFTVHSVPGTGRIDIAQRYVDSALWGSFVAGYSAAGGRINPDELPVAVRENTSLLGMYAGFGDIGGFHMVDAVTADPAGRALARVNDTWVEVDELTFERAA